MTSGNVRSLTAQAQSNTSVALPIAISAILGRAHFFSRILDMLTMTGDPALLDSNTLSMNAPPQILGHSPMMSFFSPASVALIGATDR